MTASPSGEPDKETALHEVRKMRAEQQPSEALRTPPLGNELILLRGDRYHKHP